MPGHRIDMEFGLTIREVSPADLPPAETAFDTSGNESVESNSAPFDVLAPGVPDGLEVR